MLRVSCSNCGASVSCRSPAPPARVYGQCQTVHTPSGRDIDAIGSAAIWPLVTGPIAIDLRGVSESMSFEVIGRVCSG